MTDLLVRISIVFLVVWSPFANAAIDELSEFIEKCPQRDPAYSQIRADFQIMRSGNAIGEIFCTEPISAMPLEERSKELQLLQALRVMYYMDRGRTNHLPWTSLSLYDWAKSKIAGFNIDPASAYNSCCNLISGKYFVTVVDLKAQLDLQYGLSWPTMLGQIALFGHEIRHRDGFPHCSGCGVENGCDQRYDLANLSPYAIQYWLYQQWLTGDINVGLGCMTDQRAKSQAAESLALSVNGYVDRFVENKPPTVTAPSKPLGVCPLLAKSDCLFDWAERNYPSLFSPAGASHAVDPYRYRYYSASGNYLGTSSADNRVYFLGTGGLLEVGTLSSWLTTAACQ